MAVKYVFVTGGVVSGLGKGITAASLGRLLKSRGYFVTMQKFDPYLNIDPGTMNPYQHGEVFVTDDGTETDLDLGHYERFIDCSLNSRFLISPMPLRAVFIGTLLPVKPKSLSLKLAVLSEISKVSHFWNLSVNSSMKSAVRTAC